MRLSRESELSRHGELFAAGEALCGTGVTARRFRRQEGATMKRLGVGQVILLAALIIILILTGVWAVSVWNATDDVVMDKNGWIALGLGTFFSLVIGCGLMALMFFSSRSGYDDAADPFRKKQEPPTE
jgi:hypothetical protein